MIYLAGRVRWGGQRYTWSRTQSQSCIPGPSALDLSITVGSEFPLICLLIPGISFPYSTHPGLISSISGTRLRNSFFPARAKYGVSTGGTIWNCSNSGQGLEARELASGVLEKRQRLGRKGGTKRVHEVNAQNNASPQTPGTLQISGPESLAKRAGIQKVINPTSTGCHPLVVINTKEILTDDQRVSQSSLLSGSPLNSRLRSMNTIPWYVPV